MKCEIFNTLKKYKISERNSETDFMLDFILATIKEKFENRAEEEIWNIEKLIDEIKKVWSPISGAALMVSKRKILSKLNFEKSNRDDSFYLYEVNINNIKNENGFISRYERSLMIGTSFENRTDWLNSLEFDTLGCPPLEPKKKKEEFEDDLLFSNYMCKYCPLLHKCSSSVTRDAEKDDAEVKSDISTFTPIGEQEDFLRSEADVIIVDAAAGAGKSTVLVEKLGRQWLNPNVGDYKPEEILFLTFTKIGQIELEKKVKERSKFFQDNYNNPKGEVKVMTFHSLGLELYHKYKEEWGLEHLKLFPQEHLIIERWLKDEKLTELSSKVYQTIKNTKKEVSIHKYIADIFLNEMEDLSTLNMKPSKEDALDYILSHIDSYLRYKRANFYVSFNNMIDFVYKSIVRNELPWKIIAIDEFQDSAPKEIYLVAQLRNQLERIVLMGDSTQAIFGFRGAMYNGFNEVKNILTSETGVDEIIFSKTRRVKENIALFGNMIIENVPYVNHLDSFSEGGKIYGINKAQKAEKEATLLELFLESEGSKAVICRTNRDVDFYSEIIDKLTSKNNISVVEDTSEFKAITALIKFKMVESYTPNLFDYVLYKGAIKRDFFESFGISFLAMETHLKNVDVKTLVKTEIAEIESSYLKFLFEKWFKTESFENMEEVFESLERNLGTIKYKQERIGVTLTTVHSSKGAQFDNVYISEFFKYPLKDISEREPCVAQIQNLYTDIPVEVETLFKNQKTASVSYEDQDELKIVFTAVSRTVNNLFIPYKL